MSMKEWPKLFFKSPFSREEKKMSKRYEYKVGDKVRVRDWEDMKQEFGPMALMFTVLGAGGISTPAYFSLKMRKFCGKVFAVSRIENRGSQSLVYLAGIDDWVFGYEHLILVESAPEKKSDEKTETTCDQSERIASLEAEIKKLWASEEAKVCARSSATCFQSARVKELEAETKKLREQVKGEDPMGPTADKTKARALKPILPRVLEKDGHRWVEETEGGLLCFANGGWKEGKSVLNWRHWSGGKCPVPKDTQVIVYLRDGDMGVRAASLWRWNHEKCIDGAHPRDIIAYAVVEPPKL